MALNLVFVLVGTSHAGNVGAAARAIKTMGFTTLRLVDTCSPRKQDAIVRASGADDVLENAARFEHLADAVADCHAVVGTSARQRYISVPLGSCRDVAMQVIEKHNIESDQTVAIVFGRERTGLSNEELDQCTALLQIPVNPDFSSLNLGSAVQVVAYECAMALNSTQTAEVTEPEHATGEAMQHFFDHLRRVMINNGFLDPDNPKHLMRRIQSYFERNRPTDTEINILRGILTSTEQPHPPKEKQS